MADHINIQHPDHRGVDSDHYEKRLEIEKLRVELKQLRMYYEAIAQDLESIFTRTARGETTELHYPNGDVFIISGRNMDEPSPDRGQQ